MCTHRPTFKNFIFSADIVGKNYYTCKYCNLQIILSDKYRKLYSFSRIVSIIIATMINFFIFLLHFIKLNVFQSLALILIYIMLDLLILFWLYKKAIFIPKP